MVNPRFLSQTLAEILSEREMIGHLMENILDEATRPWGVKVERVEIKVSKYENLSWHTPAILATRLSIHKYHNQWAFSGHCKIFANVSWQLYFQDVRVPVQLQRAMAAEAEAAREARAKVVAAEGEQKASLHLKEAALVLEESTSALQLRYLQVAISTLLPAFVTLPIPSI